MPPAGRRWTVVLPVKALPAAKTRLDPSRAGTGPEWAGAFMADVLAAVRACPEVSGTVVATGDDTIARLAAEHGARVVDDEGHPGINAAARHAAAGVLGGVAVLVSDLPCLTSAALTQVLAAVPSSGCAFLRDADGSGTTMWAGVEGTAVDTRFGPGSAAAHAAMGAVDLATTLPDQALAERARRDVDTPVDLDRALLLGVGEHTRRHAEARGFAALVTVARSDGDRVEVIDEGGRWHARDAAAFVAAGFREVRPGQRVRIRPDATVALP